MRAFLLFPQYIYWHYTKACASIIRITENLAWFIWHFFSIGLNMRTLFSPWQRMREERKRGFDPEDFFSALVINILMRIVGAIVRSVFIVIGLASEAVILLSGLGFMLMWIAWPLVIIFLFVAGIIFLIQP